MLTPNDDTPMAFVWSFRIHKKDHDKVAEILTTGHGMMDDQRMRPDLPYTKSRHFFRTEDSGDTEEWLVFDEVDSQEALQAMQNFTANYYKDQAEDSQTHLGVHEQLAALTLERKFPPTPVMFHELVECRVEFMPWKHRKAGLQRAKATKK